LAAIRGRAGGLPAPEMTSHACCTLLSTPSTF
jgi:hypothetical protein